MQMTQAIISALETRYQADLSEAKTNLANYLNNPVGVGEHPNIVNEADKLMSAITDASGKLNELRSLVEEINNIAKEAEAGEGSNNRK